jgi:hypothetical protein
MPESFCPKEKYSSLTELRFDKLKHRHFSLITDFRTFDSDLKAFLIEDAMRSQEMCISTTFLIFDHDDFLKNSKDPMLLTLLGYLTITADSFILTGPLKQAFREKGVNYKTLPGMKIARLCVDDRYTHRGLGSLALAYVTRKAIYSNLDCACRFIILDATRYKDPQKDTYPFYEMHGFRIQENLGRTYDTLRKMSRGTTLMYLDIYPITKGIIKTIQ